jgi:hypothetical protein
MKAGYALPAIEEQSFLAARTPGGIFLRGNDEFVSAMLLANEPAARGLNLCDLVATYRPRAAVAFKRRALPW